MHKKIHKSFLFVHDLVTLKSMEKNEYHPHHHETKVEIQFLICTIKEVRF